MTPKDNIRLGHHLITKASTRTIEICGLVVRGVKSDTINFNSDHNDIIKEWEAENSERGINIVEYHNLSQEKPHHITHHSLVIHTENTEAANKCINLGFIIDPARH